MTIIAYHHFLHFTEVPSAVNDVLHELTQNAELHPTKGGMKVNDYLTFNWYVSMSLFCAYVISSTITENVLTVARRPPEICLGYLILVAGSPTWLLKNLRLSLKFV